MIRTWVATVLIGICGLALSSQAAEREARSFPLGAKKILFLGDSITDAGQYIARIESQLLLQQVEPRPEIINLGLGSETCSGLSEPDHPFPRPDVHERLDRALAKIQPDVVVACYGMNDGIYHPFSEHRFQAYQRGIDRLIEKVHASGAKLILMTPPPFDPRPLRGSEKLKPGGEAKYAYFAMYENYDDVLVRYSEWIVEQHPRVALVIDLHTPLSVYAAERRKKVPEFTLSPDGIHPNERGHRLIGDVILRAWGIMPIEEGDEKLRRLVQQRLAILHATWLSEVGHQRPGVPPGLPLLEAQARAADLDRQIQELILAR